MAAIILFSENSASKICSESQFNDKTLNSVQFNANKMTNNTNP